jgi:UMF1 family MFS transporter
MAATTLTTDKAYHSAINAWCMYDWANSAFATTIMAAVLPVYYESVAGRGLPGNTPTVYWGYTSSIALLIGALLAPILGSIADYTGTKKKFLAVFAALGILFTALLVLAGSGDWLLASAFAICGEIGFSAANIFYDSLLPHVAKAEDMDFVSSKGYALGYLGGGILLAINIAMIMLAPSGTQELMTRLTFVTVAVWWALFSIPLFRRVAEPPRSTEGIPAGTSAVAGGFERLASTFREMSKYRELVKFIVAFWLYNDGIGTIIKMATIYGAEIGIGQTSLIGALLLTQFVGIPFSLLFGRFGRRIGTKRSIVVGLACYVLISIGGYFMSQAWHFWALAFAVGMVQGGTQALSRSLFGVMAPKAKSAEFFGFYDVSAKFAGILGPALFAVVGQLAGSSRLSIVSLVVFFAVGGWLLTRVDEREGIRVAAEGNAVAPA